MGREFVRKLCFPESFTSLQSTLERDIVGTLLIVVLLVTRLFNLADITPVDRLKDK